MSKLTRYNTIMGPMCNASDVEQLEATNAELLEALKRYVVLLDIGGRWTVEDQNTARAVIAKAEGEQP